MSDIIDRLETSAYRAEQREMFLVADNIRAGIAYIRQQEAELATLRDQIKRAEEQDLFGIAWYKDGKLWDVTPMGAPKPESRSITTKLLYNKEPK